jgi:type VI secretion system secreted protein Hcp
MYLMIWEIPNFPTKGVTTRMELNSLQWGTGRSLAVATGATGGSADRETSKPIITEVNVTRVMDENSNAIFREVITGVERPMTFYFMKGTVEHPQVYMTVSVEGALITGYNINQHGDTTIESISVNFKQVKYKYERPPTP